VPTPNVLLTVSAIPWVKQRPWIIVTLVWVALACVTATWVSLDRRPPEWDHANHLERAVLCAHDAGHGQLRSIMARSSFYPPLVPCAAGLAYLIWPSDAAAGQITIVAFLGLAMAALYSLGRALAGQTAGVTAALLFGTAPFVVFSLTRFQLDLPLAAAVAMSLLVLKRTEHFAHLGWSLGTAVTLGAGMLIKPPFAGYVVAPLLVTLTGVRTRRALQHAAFALGGALTIALPWYGPRAVGFPLQLVAQGFKRPMTEGHPEVMTAAGLTLYPRWFLTEFGVVAAVLLGLGLFVAWRRREWLLLWSMAVPFVLLEIIRNKDLRYVLPVLPVAALLAALGLAALAARGWRVALMSVTVAAVLQVLGTAFGVMPVPTFPWLGTPWIMASPPLRAQWPHREILSAIGRDSHGASAIVSVVPSTAFLSVSNLRYYAVRDGLPLQFTRAWSSEPIGVDYMVLKTGDQGPSWAPHKRAHRIGQRLAADTALASVFPVIGEYPLPDGSTAILRVRRSVWLDVDARTMGRAVEVALRRRLAEVARELDGVEVSLDYDDAIRSGRVNRLELAANTAVVGDWTRPEASRLRLYDVRIVLSDVVVNPLSALSAARFDPLAVGRVRIDEATVAASDLQAFLTAQKGFDRSRLTLGNGTVELRLRSRGPDVTARVRLRPGGDRMIAVEAERLRVGVVIIPASLANWVLRHYDPFPRLARRIRVPIDIGAISVTPGQIRITSDR
jgi:hypothetical protein